jgi:hypothetical protein
MNNLLFYTLLAFLVYVFFFNKMSEGFTSTPSKTKKECSEISINNAIYDYTISGRYVR